MRDWKTLAPRFGIGSNEADELACHYQDLSKQSYSVLLCWKQINPETATYRELIACLLVHAPFDLTETALMMLNPDAAVQETCKLLQEAYLSQESPPLWTGAPELLQFDRRLGKVTKDTPYYKLLRNIDYSTQFETLDQFSPEVEIVSIKSFLNAISEKKERIFLIKGPPRSGKTALLRRLCAFWARGFCLRRYTLILWLDLKAHPNAPLSVSLGTLLSYCLPQGSHLAIILQWLHMHGLEDVLVMIDGVEGQVYDRWKSFLEQVLASPWLKEASVLLTVASTQISKLSHAQFDLLGLSQDQVEKQVIHRYCDNTSKAEEFLTYISENPKIRMLCSSPPYLSAVLFVFENTNTSDPPNSWTQLFTSLNLSLLGLASMSDHSILAVLSSKAYAVTNDGSSFDWHYSYADFFSAVTPPYRTIAAPADNTCFTLPLLQHYLCAWHIHNLILNQHVASLNQETLPFHVKKFYVGLCNSSENVEMVLQYELQDMHTSSACITEIPVERLQQLMSSQLTITDKLLSMLDIHCIFQAVYHSGLACSLKFSVEYFRLQLIVKWLRVKSVLPSGGTVQELILSENHISNEGTSALAGALQVNQSLQSLDLSTNSISNEEVSVLAGALQVNQSLQTLDLSRNNISNEGASALAGALQVNQSLRTLNLSRSNISKEGASILAGPLQVNQSLQTLDLSGNNISSEGASASLELCK